MVVRIDENRILDEIERLLERRDKITSLTEYYYSYSDLYNLAEVYQMLTNVDLFGYIANNPKLENYMKKYLGPVRTNLHLYFLEQDEHTKLAENVLKVFEESEFISYGRKDVNKISKKEFFKIERDFLGTYDERLLKLFDSRVERGLIDMRGDTPPTAYPTFCSDYHYVILPEEYNIDNLSSISHELGHLHSNVVLDVRSKKQLSDAMITYQEAYSHYMEMCLFEYLKKNHIYLGDTLIDENNYYSRIMKYFKYLKSFENVEKTERDNDILYNISDYYKYSYGILIGTLLHERYLENEIETKKDIDNFLFTQGLLDKQEELEVLGLSREKLNDTKVLAKRLQRHNENYRKYN